MIYNYSAKFPDEFVISMSIVYKLTIGSADNPIAIAELVPPDDKHVYFSANWKEYQKELSGNWEIDYSSMIIYFELESDYTLFVLKWSI